MRLQFQKIWILVRSSLWFIPSMMVVSAAVLGYMLVQLDQLVEHEEWHIKWFIYGGNPQGARSVLSTIASSMVTIAGVTFSITLVALTMASSQFGPRLLRNFISDKANQLVLGTFIATFIYSLVVLLTIRGSEDSSFVPKISIAFAFILAVASLGVLIFFIHHVASSIQAETVIKNAYKEFDKAVKHIMVDEVEENSINSLEQALSKVKEDFYNNRIVTTLQPGYIQLIDYNRLCNWAEENDVVVNLLYQTGDFITIHQRIAEVYYRSQLPNNITEEINRCVITGIIRTSDQDIEFSIKQVVEVGVRALSPGINDPHTAISCINWLGVMLMQIAFKKFPPIAIKNKQGQIRVIKKMHSFNSVVQTCFDQIRLYARSNIFVSTHLLATIKKVLSEVKKGEIRSELQQMAHIIVSDIHLQVTNDRELAFIDKEYREVMEAYTR